MEGLIGRELGNYRILRELGRGSMGVVYHALQTTLERDVALKVLAPNLVGDRDLLERFLREARLAAKLNHPNVVHIYDQGDDGDLFYIAMEYVAGRSLRQVIDAEGKLAPQRALEIAIQVCEALQYAHGQGVVHRDIKPDNIMIQGGSGLIKVTDFGLAKGIASTTLTTPGAFLGSPHFMSMEQLRGEPVDGRADIYSLGRVLYLMLAGRPPFETADFVSLVVHEINDEAPALRQFAPEVSEDLEAVVMKAQAKAREDRFQSAAEMLAALRGLKTGSIRSPVLASGAKPTSLTRPAPVLAQAPAPPAVPEATPFVDAWDTPEQAAEVVPAEVEVVVQVPPSWPVRLWAMAAYAGLVGLLVLLVRQDKLAQIHARQALALHLMRLAVIATALAFLDSLTLNNGLSLLVAGVPIMDRWMMTDSLLAVLGAAALFWLVALIGAVQAGRARFWRMPILSTLALTPLPDSAEAGANDFDHVSVEERQREEEERGYWEQLYAERRQRFEEAVRAAERERERREKLRAIVQRAEQILANVDEINDRFSLGDFDLERFHSLKRRYNNELAQLKEEAKKLGESVPVKEPQWLPD